MSFGDNAWTQQRSRATVLTLAIVAAGYFLVLLHLDQSGEMLPALRAMSAVMPAVAVCSLATYLFRFLRWRWLLSRHGDRVMLLPGLLAYVAGFAFTITPGKAGELVRIRYYGWMGVRADRVIACFVFERLADLIALLLIAALIAGTAPGFGVAFGFVVLVLAGVAMVGRMRGARLGPIRLLRRAHWKRPASVLSTLGRGLEKSLQYFNAGDAFVAVAIGLAAWGLQAASFLILLAAIGIELPTLTALAILPAATLIGAASMLPGGIGATETATTLLLYHFGAPIDQSAAAAVGMRMATIWLSVVVGLMAVLVLEAGHEAA